MGSNYKRVPAHGARRASLPSCYHRTRPCALKHCPDLQRSGKPTSIRDDIEYSRLEFGSGSIVISTRICTPAIDSGARSA